MSFKSLSVVVSGVFIAAMLAHNVAAMSPDDVKKAGELIEKDTLLRTEIDQAKTPGAKMSVDVFTLRKSDKDEGCRSWGYEANYYKTPEGGEFCRRYTGGLQVISPAFIADLQRQLDEIDVQLKVLGVAPPFCESKSKP